jgi:hypothetical protein
VRGSVSPVTALPFTVIATAAMIFLLEIRPNGLFGAADGPAQRNRRQKGSKSGWILPCGRPWNKADLCG